MSTKFASNRNPIASCDRCGFRFMLKELKEQIVKLKPTGLLVCPECLDLDHPQLQLGMYPVYDPQALQYARPELGTIESRNIVWGWRPSVPGLSVTCSVGTVTIQ